MRTAVFLMLLIFPGFIVSPAFADDSAGPESGIPESLVAKDTSLPYVRHNRDSRLAASMVYFHLACLSARLKMYPLAMKLFLRSAKPKRNAAISDKVVSAGMTWHITRQEDSLLTLPEKAPLESGIASMSSLLETFRDTAGFCNYALIIMVKQPVFNKRKVFTGIGNVGHTFITLIRFNRDNTYAARSFGFYPKKTYPLAASPVFPATAGVFRDDANHDWDEMAGRFISKDQFGAIIRTMASYKGRRYHLSRNNCTDFGLALAGLGGIRIADTRSRWPLGRGNNPAWTGQSILSGNVCNADSANDDIFITMHHPEDIRDKRKN